MNEEQINYAKLLAAQNESARRLRIINIENTLSDERRRRNLSAIIAGACMSGAAMLSHIQGIDINHAVELERQALTSYAALKEYLSMLTPSFYACVTVGAANILNFIRHRRNYNRASRELDAMNATAPEMFLDDIERQAQGRNR